MSDSNKKSRIRAKGTCPECKSNNLYLSEYRGSEAIAAAFLPRNAFQCADCNTRFWGYQSLFANALRVWMLLFCFIVILVVAFLFFQPHGDSQTSLSRKAEFIPQFDSGSTADRASDANNKQLSGALSSTEIDQNLGTPLVDDAENNAQINDVKNQSQQISDTIKSSIERLESAFVEDQKALVSLLKIDINHTIESWRKAWQSGAEKKYFSHYSNNFKPSNFLPLKEWRLERAERISSANNIEVNLSDFDVSFTDDNKRAVALFTQSYFSKKYAEVSRKKLVLVNEQDEWKIVLERDVN